MLIQIPISLLVERQLKIGVKVQKIMMSGVCTLGISMLFFNASRGLLGVVLVFCGVFIFSLGRRYSRQFLMLLLLTSPRADLSWNR